MITIILLISTIICAFGWFLKHVSLMSILTFIEKKGYTQPTGEELKECTDFVLKKIFKIY